MITYSTKRTSRICRKKIQQGLTQTEKLAMQKKRHQAFCLMRDAEAITGKIRRRRQMRVVAANHLDVCPEWSNLF